MNLLSYYQEKIFSCLKNLEKKKLIQISSELKKISVELPPKNHKADISCNAAMILAKFNNVPPIELGRVAAQNAKGVIIQKVREADKSRQFEEYKDKIAVIHIKDLFNFILLSC